MTNCRAYRVFILAGEPSGDALAARLMHSLKTLAPNVSFHGVGGPLMAAEGLVSLFPMEELSVMGLVEVLPRLPRLLRRIDETAHAAKELRPDIFITVDAPDFSFRVTAKLKGAPFPKLHYVAPSVWAWRPGRAKKIAALYDHLLTLLPFEPPYFEAEGLSASFVGHSVIESGAGKGDGAAFRKRYKIGEAEQLLMLLPGSRRGEGMRHLPVFRECVRRLQPVIGEFRLLVPVIGRAGEIVREEMAGWGVPHHIIEGEADKYDAMAAANVALAASGTVALELALARLPSVIAYRMNPLTVMIARRFVRTQYANLVNILLQREAVPECVIENCTAEKILPVLVDLFQRAEIRDAQIAACTEAMLLLGEGGPPPGRRAAEIVMKLIKEGVKR